MKENKKFNKPEVQFVIFPCEDIIVTSIIDEYDENDPENQGGGN